MHTKPLLQLKNISYTYKSKYQHVTAVKNLSYSFYSGSFYSIIGKSGSGKTTLLSLMAGLDHPTEGDIYFESQNLDTIYLDDYRKVVEKSNEWRLLEH